MSIRTIISLFMIINVAMGFVKINIINDYKYYTKMKLNNDKLQHIYTFTQFLDNSYLNNMNSYTVYLNNSNKMNRTANYKISEIIEYNNYLNMGLRNA